MTPPRQIHDRNYRVSAAPGDIDVAAAHAFLSRAYWSEAIPLALLERAFANSLCFSLRCWQADGREEQVGFARYITDRATYAYLCDVYVLEAHRGQGLGDFLIGESLAHPDLQGLRRLQLITRDAHRLYARHGFKPQAAPERGMEVSRPGLYLKQLENS
jgi:GNAT superfamily N-acetyltransferase